MSLKAKRKRNMGIMIICLILIAIVFIYPVYLMFMNSFKPFGEIVADVLAFPKHFEQLYICNQKNGLCIAVPEQCDHYRDRYCRNCGLFFHGSIHARPERRKIYKDCICNHYNTNADSVSDNYDHTVKIHECTASVRQQDRTGYPVLGIWNSDGNLYFL